MRFAAYPILAVATLALAACSGNADDATETAAVDTAAPMETATPAMAASATTVLNANTATAEQLAAAPGMTPALAEAVVAGRPYASVTDFNKKLRESLNEAQAATILRGVFVPVNLNTATEDELELIPGMTDKMEHEFEEYRPYADMSVFDREIGKYVDEAEVARFRNYVTL